MRGVCSQTARNCVVKQLIERMRFEGIVMRIRCELNAVNAQEVVRHSTSL